MEKDNGSIKCGAYDFGGLFENIYDKDGKLIYTTDEIAEIKAKLEKGGCTIVALPSDDEAARFMSDPAAGK